MSESERLYEEISGLSSVSEASTAHEIVARVEKWLLGFVLNSGTIDGTSHYDHTSFQKLATFSLVSLLCHLASNNAHICACIRTNEDSIIDRLLQYVPDELSDSSSVSHPALSIPSLVPYEEDDDDDDDEWNIVEMQHDHCVMVPSPIIRYSWLKAFSSLLALSICKTSPDKSRILETVFDQTQSHSKAFRIKFWVKLSDSLWCLSKEKKRCSLSHDCANFIQMLISEQFCKFFPNYIHDILDNKTYRLGSSIDGIQTLVAFFKLWRRCVKEDRTEQNCLIADFFQSCKPTIIDFMLKVDNYDLKKSILKLLISLLNLEESSFKCPGDRDGGCIIIESLLESCCKDSVLSVGFAGQMDVISGNRQGADARFSPLFRLHILLMLNLLKIHTFSDAASFQYFLLKVQSLLQEKTSATGLPNLTFVLVNAFSEKDDDLINLLSTSIGMFKNMAGLEVNNMFNPLLLFTTFLETVNFDTDILLDWIISEETNFQNWLTDFLDWLASDHKVYFESMNLEAGLRSFREDVSKEKTNSLKNVSEEATEEEKNILEGLRNDCDIPYVETPLERFVSCLSLLSLKLESMIDRKLLGMHTLKFVQKIDDLENAFEQWKSVSG